MAVYSRLEFLRQKIKKCNTCALVAFAGLFLGFFAVPFMSSMGEASDSLKLLMGIGILIFPVCIITFIVSIVKGGKYNKEFKFLYKNNFIIGLVKQQFPDAQVNWDRGFTSDAVAAVGLVQMGNRFKSEDYICGTYNGVFFEQSDVLIQEVHHSDDGTTTYTHFRGRMFTFNYDLKDVVSTLVFSKDFVYKGRGFGFKYEKVKLESVGFNDNFKILSARPVDAFYILTPQMMECVYGLERYLGNIAIHFTPGKVHVAFNSNYDAFELNTKNQIDYNMEAMRIRGDMQVIIDIINALRLCDNNINTYK